MFIQYKSDLNNQTVKLDEYQQRAVVQIEKYQLLTERAAAEREELQIINRTAQVNKFAAAFARFGYRVFRNVSSNIEWQSSSWKSKKLSWLLDLISDCRIRSTRIKKKVTFYI